LVFTRTLLAVFLGMARPQVENVLFLVKEQNSQSHPADGIAYTRPKASSSRDFF